MKYLTSFSLIKVNQIKNVKDTYHTSCTLSCTLFYYWFSNLY